MDQISVGFWFRPATAAELGVTSAEAQAQCNEELLYGFLGSQKDDDKGTIDFHVFGHTWRGGTSTFGATGAPASPMRRTTRRPTA